MKLVHASISETGGAGWDGRTKAGDQTGKEVYICSWYSKPWDFMLHYPNRTIANKASSAAVKLAKSNLVGYNQSDRNSLYRALKAVNFNVDDYIKSGLKTETDCSAFIYAVYCCFIPEMRSNENAPVTANMKEFYKKAGFSISFDSSHLTGKSLLNGDILVKEKSHTAMATDGNSFECRPVNIIELPKISSEVNAAITTIALDVIKGNWGNGLDRKEKLYYAIQTKVNDLLI